MQDLDMSSHLSYVQSFVFSTKAIMGEIEWQRLSGESSLKPMQKLQAVGNVLLCLLVSLVGVIVIFLSC